MQNEKNENNQPESTSQQGSDLKKQEIKRSSRSSADDNLSKNSESEKATSSTTANFKVIYLSLLEAATRYRESYFRDEIKGYEDGLEADRQNQLAKTQSMLKQGQMINTRVFHRTFDRQKENKVINFRLSIEKVNRMLYAEVEEVEKKLSDQAKKSFDNYATGFGLIAEQYIKAKNTKELLTVCEIYNAGQFDKIFGDIKTIKNNQTIATAMRNSTDDEIEQPSATKVSEDRGDEHSRSHIS